MFFKCANHAPADHSQGQTVSRNNKHFTVDIHCHIQVPEADAMLKQLAPDDTGRKMVDTNPITARINSKQQQTIWPKLTEPEIRLKDMDAQGIDVQAISTSPFHYNYGYDADFGRDCVCCNYRNHCGYLLTEEVRLAING